MELSTFPAGAEVLHGSFYLAEDYVQHTYTLDEEKDAIVTPHYYPLYLF